MDYYRGFINQQVLKGAIGAKGGVNPIATKSIRKPSYVGAFETRERQQFIQRYKWQNLPKGLTQNLMERILYYRGRLVVYKQGDTYMSLPFALNGNIDVYGRYQAVTPLTFNGSVVTDEDGNSNMGDGPVLTGDALNVAYDKEDLEGKECVILNDYTQGNCEYIIPRYQANLYFNNDMADIAILIRHNLISSARVYAIRCLDEGQKEAVLSELDDMENAILEQGQRVFPIVSSTDIKEFLQDKNLETQQYWECFVSLDNLRENMIGIENNGIFKKKERQLKGEQELEASSADLVYADGLYCRQLFCEVFNVLFGENVSCVESDTIRGVDNSNVEESEVEEDGRGEI